MLPRLALRAVVSLAVLGSLAACTIVTVESEFLRRHAVPPDSLVAAWAAQQRASIQLPNLIVRRIEWRRVGPGLELRATIRNDGEKDTAGFAVMALVRRNTDPTGSPCLPLPDAAGLQGAPLLPRQSQRDFYLGAIENPGSVTLVTTVIVDPPTSAAPGGQIWESSELDNVRTKTWNCDAIGCVEQPGDPVPICPG